MPRENRKRRAYKMQKLKHVSVTLESLLLLVSFSCFVFNGATDYIPPAKLDGFVYENRALTYDTILIEAFYDPVCPDSRDSWPPLKQALNYYGDRVSLVVHLLPLPYHDNAFVASRALHVVNGLNRSATFPLLEWFFKHQEIYYSAKTQYLSRDAVVDQIAKSVTEVVGSSYYHSIKSGFNDSKTDLQTRVSFKYAASRGVSGTPFFYVNGFLLPDTGSAVDYNTWRKVIDPLIDRKSVKNEDSLHFFL